MTVRVLIADDQALVRAGFRMILDAEEDIDVIGEAADGSEAVEQTKRLDPDVVLMDIRMPELDGIEATRRVIDGASRASPRATTRMPAASSSGGTSFKRNPLAPARSAS